jgi:hypothetical protein
VLTNNTTLSSKTPPPPNSISQFAFLTNSAAQKNASFQIGGNFGSRPEPHGPNDGILAGKNRPPAPLPQRDAGLLEQIFDFDGVGVSDWPILITWPPVSHE